MSTPAPPGSPQTSSVPLDLAQSAAGEEDPGAWIDLPATAAAPAPESSSGRPPGGTQAPMSPGDEAPPGAPGTGEDVCPRCGGSGTLAGGNCPMCQGTGKVTAGIGGA